jgi:hypothetical protein
MTGTHPTRSIDQRIARIPPLTRIPLARILHPSRTLLIPMVSIPLARIPLAHIPLTRIPLARIALARTLSGLHAKKGLHATAGRSACRGAPGMKKIGDCE